MNENQFERVTGYEDADLPVRKTEYAAGYDIKPYENGVVLPHQQNSFLLVSNAD